MSINVDRLAYVGRRAYELARSGYHEDFASIQTALMDEGFADAVPWLELPGVMMVIEQICSIACQDAESGYAARVSGYRSDHGHLTV